MSATKLSRSLAAQRELLAVWWLRRLMENQIANRRALVAVPEVLILRLLDEVGAMLSGCDRNVIPRLHHARAFAELADFPECVELCIDTLEAGSQVIGAFIVENAGASAAWTISRRNRFLGDLDAVFHILVRREIEALCELRLEHVRTDADFASATAAASGLLKGRGVIPMRN